MKRNQTDWRKSRFVLYQASAQEKDALKCLLFFHQADMKMDRYSQHMKI